MPGACQPVYHPIWRASFGLESDDRLRTTLRVLRQTTRRNETDTFA